MSDLDGRRIVVAGAGGGGIGTGICAGLTAAGASVVGLDVTDEGLAQAEPQCAVVRRCDVTDEAALDAALDEVGPVDGLVHVVGGMRGDVWGRTDLVPLDAVESVLRLNLTSAFTTTRAVGRRLVEQEHGSIVHIVSIAGFVGMPFGAAYGAAKAGLMSLVRTTALEWGRFGVRTNAVACGSIRVSHSKGGTDDPPETRWAIPLGRRGEPHEVAEAVTWLLSDRASFVTGQVLTVDGGASTRPGYLDEDDLPVILRGRGPNDWVR